jgi:hypothetical protein
MQLLGEIMKEPYSTRKMTYIFGGMFVFLMLFLFLSTNSFVVVEENSDNSGALFSAQKFSPNEQPKQLRTGLNVLRTGTYEATVSKGISLTKKEFDAKAFRIHKMALKLEPQLQASKVARGANDCVFGDSQGIRAGTVFSYDCSEPTSVFRNSFVGFSKKELFTSISPGIEKPTSHKNGVVGLVFGEEGYELVYVTQNPTVRVPITSEAGYDDELGYTLTSDQKAVYLLSPVKKTIYKTEDFSKKPEKIQLDIESDVPDKFNRLQKFENRYYLFVGEKPKENTDSVEKGTFYIFGENGGKPIKSIKVKDGADGFLNFSVISKDLVYSNKLDQVTTLFSLENDRINSIQSIKNVTAANAVGGQLFILSNQNVFKYNPETKSTSLVFGSSKMKASSLQAVDGQLVINAYSNTEKNPINHTYILDADSPVKEEGRNEDKLPYGDIDTRVSFMDYLGSTIYVALQLDSLRKDPASGNYVYDAAEFAAAKNELISQLKADGITPDKYSITFNPY